LFFRSLPDKYRFLLFEEKREVELVWNGKTGEVCNIVLPFQEKYPAFMNVKEHCAEWLRFFKKKVRISLDNPPVWYYSYHMWYTTNHSE